MDRVSPEFFQKFLHDNIGSAYEPTPDFVHDIGEKPKFWWLVGQLYKVSKENIVQAFNTWFPDTRYICGVMPDEDEFIGRSNSANAHMKSLVNKKSESIDEQEQKQKQTKQGQDKNNQDQDNQDAWAWINRTVDDDSTLYSMRTKKSSHNIDVSVEVDEDEGEGKYVAELMRKKYSTIPPDGWDDDNVADTERGDMTDEMLKSELLDMLMTDILSDPASSNASAATRASV